MIGKYNTWTQRRSRWMWTRATNTETRLTKPVKRLSVWSRNAIDRSPKINRRKLGPNLLIKLHKKNRWPRVQTLNIIYLRVVLLWHVIMIKVKEPCAELSLLCTRSRRPPAMRTFTDPFIHNAPTNADQWDLTNPGYDAAVHSHWTTHVKGNLNTTKAIIIIILSENNLTIALTYHIP